MAMSDNIREGVSQRREEMSSEEKLRDLINSAASKSMKQFIQRLDSGEIPIDNVADFMRVINVYKEINDIDSAMDSRANKASLPEINMKQDKVIEQQVEEGKAGVDEEGRLDISEMSTEDVADMIRQMDIAQNTENEGTF